MPGSVELSFMGWGEEQIGGMHGGGAALLRKGSAKAT